MSAYTHNGDFKLMTRLGLRTEYGQGWTNLGVVVVREADTENEYRCPTGPRPKTTIEVEVCSLPAQFWRFTIIRPRDEVRELGAGEWHAVYEPVERFSMETGSGAFSKYWPMAVEIAEQMVTVRDLNAPFAMELYAAQWCDATEPWGWATDSLWPTQREAEERERMMFADWSEDERLCVNTRVTRVRVGEVPPR